MSFLDIHDLHLTMRSFDGSAHVLNGIDLSVDRGEIWGLVGETGCGKSLTGLSISRLVAMPPGHYPCGSIRLGGREILQTSEEDMRRLRGRHIGMIFQDPTTNLVWGYSCQVLSMGAPPDAGWLKVAGPELGRAMHSDDLRGARLVAGLAPRNLVSGGPHGSGPMMQTFASVASSGAAGPF